MAANVANSFIDQWGSEVHILYTQKGSKLRDCVRTITGITGSTHKFHVFGNVVANSKSRGADVTGLDPSQAVVTATLADSYAPIYIDKLDELKTNADVRGEYVKLSAQALGRKTDDIIVSALDASTPGTTIATGAVGLTLQKLIDAKQALDEGDVDADDRILVVSPAAIADILTEEKLTSADYMQVQGIINGEVNKALGFTWKVSTRLSLNTTTRDCYAFSKSAVGLAIGQDLTTAVDWVPEKVSHLVNSYLSMGAVAIEGAGIVKVQITE